MLAEVLDSHACQKQWEAIKTDKACVYPLWNLLSPHSSSFQGAFICHYRDATLAEFTRCAVMLSSNIQVRRQGQMVMIIAKLAKHGPHLHAIMDVTCWFDALKVLLMSSFQCFIFLQCSICPYMRYVFASKVGCYFYLKFFLAGCPPQYISSRWQMNLGEWLTSTRLSACKWHGLFF